MSATQKHGVPMDAVSLLLVMAVAVNCNLVLERPSILL
jgi:hypothetical protein